MPEFKTGSEIITGDIQVIVPESPRFMTTFVLQEQRDWFEDEISFVRFYIKPGMKVIDIGANYGCYALTMAKNIGGTGRLWAFEPTRETAACLEKSILANGFDSIELVQAGLSGECGEARFFTSPNSELNSLSVIAAGGDGNYETIRLLTLDYCKDLYEWDEIDFIKLDAEGEEGNILRGGDKTLSFLSPLIMFELKHGDSINLPLIEQLEGVGYSTYRLVPGLSLLVPFDRSEPFDDYLLNLFSCKEDKARQLEQEGMLVRKKGKGISDVCGKAKEYISGLDYGKSIARLIDSVECCATSEYSTILDEYAVSLSVSVGACDRLGHLKRALYGVRNMLDKGEARVERLSTFSRIAFDSGERALGVKILTRLIRTYSKSLNFKVETLFFPACVRYDSIDPKSNINAWLFSSILEQWVAKHAFSSYFSREVSLPILKRLESMGFIDECMRRRFLLIKQYC